MNPQEIQKQNIEFSKIPEKKEGKNENINIPKSGTLSKYPNFDVFTKTLNTLDIETKNKLLAILESIPDDELSMYIEMDADNSNLITNDDIKRFITEKETYNGQKTNIKVDNLIQAESNIKIKEEEKVSNPIVSWQVTSENIKNQIQEKAKSNKDIEQEKGEKKLNELIPKYKNIFAGDKEISNILKNIENNIDKGNIVKENLEKLVKDEKIAKRFFDGIATTKDTTLYQETIQLFTNYGVSLPVSISPVIYEIEPKPVKIPPEIVAQLPGAKPEDIEKRGNLVSYNGKTIDLKTGRAFISGEGGYAIETSMKVPNSLDLRVKYQKERLEILDEIKTNEKILDLVKNKHKLKENLENLKKQKTENIGDNLPINIKINEIETEIKKIDEKLKQAVPGYNETQDEAFMRFLKYKIESAQEKLISIKTQFDKNMQELLKSGQDEIKARDEKVRETIKFLDILGLTNINQNDLQKIINNINMNISAFPPLSKKIDLEKGFTNEGLEKNKFKNEFIELFSKLYKKMGIKVNPIRVIDGSGYALVDSENNPVENKTIKQSLENAGITRGGSLNIETTMKILSEKEEETKKEAA